MAQHGQEYWPNIPPLVAGSDDDRIVDMAKRRRDGYGLAANQTPPPSGPDDKQPAFQLALFGSDQDRLALQPRCPLPAGESPE